MSKLTRQFILFGAPLFVGVINLFHPVHFEPTGVYEGVKNQVDWWITLHTLNLAGFALLGLAALLLVKDQQGLAARITKISLAVFVPTYVGFDSIIGIGTGTLIQYARNLTPGQLKTVESAIDAYWVGAMPTMLAIIGSVAWNLGMSMSAVAFTEPKRRPAIVLLGFLAGAVDSWGYSASTFGTASWWVAVILIGLMGFVISRWSLPISLLILSGILFGQTHVVPFGPLGMACFVAAAAWLEFAPRQTRMTQTMATASS